MRVQIHLNLANPELAENVVRVQNHRGTWVGVAYATEVVLGDAIPVIDGQAQRRISQGEGKKTPHAFLEGELLHFRGRLRDKAPESLKQMAQDHLAPSDAFPDFFHQAQREGSPVNYNPRFASCFYLDQEDKSLIKEEYVHSPILVGVGWKFSAVGATFRPLPLQARCEEQALERTSVFERRAIAAGRKQTRVRMTQAQGQPPRPGR